MHATLGNLGPPKDIGDRPVFEALFYDEPSDEQVALGQPGDPVDPDEVWFFYKMPGTAEAHFQWTVDDEITHDEVGVFRFEVPTLTLPGRHYVRVKATEGIITAAEGWFLVNRSEFTTP